MILKPLDYLILMRGYESDKAEIEKLENAYNEKYEALKKCKRERELFKKNCGEENLGDAFTKSCNKAEEELEKAYVDLISYDGGDFFKSIVEIYKSSGRSIFQITRAFRQAEKEMPIPQVDEEDGKILVFSDCDTREDVFRWTVERCLEYMKISRPIVRTITRFPQSYLISTDKGTRELFKLGTTIEVGEELSVSLGKGGSSQIERIFQNIGTKVVDYDPSDLDVLTLCNSFFDRGNEYVPIQSIARAMREGKDGNISDKTIEEISDSIKRLMYPITLLYYTEKKEYTKRNREWEEVSGTYTGAILPCEIVTANINGKEVFNCVHFFDKSILFRLAEMKFQVQALPASAIAYKGYTNRGVRALVNFIYQRIVEMYPGRDGKDKDLSLRTILVRSLLEETIKDEEKRKNRRVKKNQLDKAIKILEQYQKDGIIYSFGYNYDIEPNERKQKIIIAMNKEQDKELWEIIKVGIKPQKEV